jgi:hypothetical protein
MNQQQKSDQLTSLDTYSAQQQSQNDVKINQSTNVAENILRISTREKNVTGRVHYLISLLNSGKSTAIHAYGMAMNNANLISTILRQERPEIK